MHLTTILYPAKKINRNSIHISYEKSFRPNWIKTQFVLYFHTFIEKKEKIIKEMDTVVFN